MRTSIRLIAGFGALLWLPACSTTGDPVSAELTDFQDVEVQQRTEVWCWAACAEMVLRYGGVETSQEEIAARIHGHGQDGPKVAAASRYEVYRALSPESPDTPFEALWEGISAEVEGVVEDVAEDPVGGSLDARADVDDGQCVDEILDRFAPKKGVPIDELLEEHPAVAGLRESPELALGHVYVLIGATYREKSWAGEVAEKVGDWTTGVVEALTDLDEDQTAAAESAANRFGPSKYDVESVLLVDPYMADDPATEANERHVRLSFEEFLSRVDFVTTRSDANEILTRWSQVARIERK